jgi:hypothetical protein
LPLGKSPKLSEALEHFIDNFSQHSKKSSELIDVLIQALKTVNQELQQQKLKNHLREGRLKRAEARVDEIERVMDAYRRRGWLQ